nr:MAG TPA: hypothetical protein [Caudoviricetes sp.]
MTKLKKILCGHLDSLAEFGTYVNSGNRKRHLVSYRLEDSRNILQNMEKVRMIEKERLNTLAEKYAHEQPMTKTEDAEFADMLTQIARIVYLKNCRTQHIQDMDDMLQEMIIFELKAIKKACNFENIYALCFINCRWCWLNILNRWKSHKDVDEMERLADYQTLKTDIRGEQIWN